MKLYIQWYTVRAHHLEASIPSIFEGPETSSQILVLKGAAWKKDAIQCEGHGNYLVNHVCKVQAKCCAHLFLYSLFQCIFLRGKHDSWWPSAALFRGRRNIWWTSYFILRGKRSIWRTSSSMFRGRRKEFEALGGQTCGETLKRNVGILWSFLVAGVAQKSKS